MLSSMREFARLLVRERPDAIIGSAVGLLTTAFLVRGDASPLDTLNRLALWARIDVSDALANADDWLNAPARHRILVVGCLLAGLAMLGVISRQIATEHQERRASRWLEEREGRPWGSRWYGEHGLFSYRLNQETRFWSVTFIVTGLLAQLREVTWARVAGGAAVILASMLVAARTNAIRRAHDDGHRRVGETPRVDWLLDAAWVVGWTFFRRACVTLLALPVALWVLAAYPRAKGRERRKASNTAGDDGSSLDS